MGGIYQGGKLLMVPVTATGLLKIYVTADIP